MQHNPAKEGGILSVTRVIVVTEEYRLAVVAMLPQVMGYIGKDYAG
jgi:hypothetical protein